MRINWDSFPFAEFNDLKDKARTARYMKMKSFEYLVESRAGLKRLTAMLELCNELLRTIPMSELQQYVSKDVLHRVRKKFPPIQAAMKDDNWEGKMMFGSECILRRGSQTRTTGEGCGRDVRVKYIGASGPHEVYCELLEDDLSAPEYGPRFAGDRGWWSRSALRSK